MPSPIIVKSWFKKANGDLKIARFITTNSDDEVLESCAFHCQQSIEKSLKGFLTAKKVRFAKIHDLRELAQAALEAESDLGFIKENSKLLAKITDYAVSYRYPDANKELPSLVREDVYESIALAEKCFNELSKRC